MNRTIEGELVVTYQALENVNGFLLRAFVGIVVFGGFVGLSEFLIDAPRAAAAVTTAGGFSAAILLAAQAGHFALRRRFISMNAGHVILLAFAVLANLMFITRPELYFQTALTAVVILVLKQAVGIWRGSLPSAG